MLKVNTEPKAMMEGFSSPRLYVRFGASRWKRLMEKLKCDHKKNE